jgi:HD superfamily phosphohydrolase
MLKTQRIRDPVHTMIVFDHVDGLDMAVWRLLGTPEVQRLRRIRQLGVSDFVYPSATHTRFAHSIGVFQNARRLVQLIRREIGLGRAAGQFDDHRAKVAVFAALLHDVGHGPFSHAFEEARKAIAERRGTEKKIRKHEAFTADMIKDPGSMIGSILTEAGVAPEEVANLVEAETAEDMYHAVVSSSFDADRLDYVQRDRYMTGVGTGAIDLEWLMDNVRVAEIVFLQREMMDAMPRTAIASVCYTRRGKRLKIFCSLDIVDTPMSISIRQPGLRAACLRSIPADC